MTDLEAHVNQPGRKELVKKVRAKINELGIAYIYYQFVSVTGRIVGKGIPADHWEATAERGFQLVYGSTANLFVDRHKQLYRLRPGSLRTGRHSRSRHLRAAAVGQARRARVLHLLPQPRGAGQSGRPSDLRLPRQPAHPARGVPEEAQGPASAPRLRAGDDVAEEGRGRPARRRLHQAELLSHRPVRSAASGLPAGDRVFPRHGSRHDPGRPRGRAGPARAELHVRRCAAHRATA